MKYLIFWMGLFFLVAGFMYGAAQASQSKGPLTPNRVRVSRYPVPHRIISHLKFFVFPGETHQLIQGVVFDEHYREHEPRYLIGTTPLYWVKAHSRIGWVKLPLREPVIVNGDEEALWFGVSSHPSFRPAQVLLNPSGERVITGWEGEPPLGSQFGIPHDTVPWEIVVEPIYSK